MAELQTALLLKDVTGEVVYEALMPERAGLCPDCSGTGYAKGANEGPRDRTCDGTGLVASSSEVARIAKSVVLTEVVPDTKGAVRAS